MKRELPKTSYWKNSVIIAVMLVLCPIMAVGQSADVQQSINSIRLEGEHYYGEATASTHEAATGLAIKACMRNINIERSEQNKSMLDTTHVMPLLHELSYNRGDRVYVFVYANINAINSIQVCDAATESEDTDANLDATEKDIAANIMVREMVRDIHRHIETRIKKGEISNAKLVKDVNEVPDNAYMIMFDELGGKIAFFTPKKGTTRTNLMPNGRNEIKYYSPARIMWYRCR